MDAPATAKILCALAEMPDPRHHNVRHKLIDILTIALFATLCGADGWVDVVRYGRSKQAWLSSFLELPHGIPSHDTFGKVFARLNPAAMEECFGRWIAQLVQLSAGQLVAIDGKSLRRSFEHGWDKAGMAHMVSAFVAANQMVFAQLKTDGPGQELDGVQKLLGLLDLNGAVVSLDALGCQTDVARQIQDGGGRYVLHVKDNQQTLHATMRRLFDELLLENFADLRHDYISQTEGDHGRIETRRLWVIWDVELLGDLAKEWPGLRSLILVERTRQVNGQPTPSVERHYFISSLDRRTKAKRLAGYVRGHWRVENNLHWQLDVSFDEDQRRIRCGHGAENFSRLCRMALNLLKAERTAKVGIAAKRKMCGWDNDYLLKVVAG
jgi:predicted transposase YbfD/YdcC